MGTPTSFRSHLVAVAVVVVALATLRANATPTTSPLNSPPQPASGPQPPSDWAPRIAGAHMLWSATGDSSLPSNHLPVMANGFSGWQVNSGSMFISGVFNGYLTKDPSHRAAVPSTVNVVVKGAQNEIAALDMEVGTYYRRGTLPASSSCSVASGFSCSVASLVGDSVVHYEQRWYAHRLNATLFIMDIRVWVEGSAQLDGSSPFAHLNLTSSPSSSSDVTLNPVSVPSGAGYTLVNGSTNVAETTTSALTGLAVASSTLPPVLSVTSNNSVTSFITAFRTSLETPSTLLSKEAAADWAAASAAAAAGHLWESHALEWLSTVWNSRIELTGTSSTPGSLPGNALGLAQAINMSAYSILASVREDRPYSLSPGGLTPGYNGHTFWDCETWMFPTIAVFHPDLAGSILQYRFNRMDGAKEKAKSYDPPYAGTMFPWESAFTGEEVCPSWAATGLREIHISGDIAFALNQYWTMTRDMEWLEGVGRPMFSNIAEFWLSKATANPDGSLSINDVIPPDEYHDHVNNSAYTNSVARLSFEYAVMADHQVGLPPAASLKYSQAATKLIIPFDPKLMIHPEYDGYNGGTIKQADVILMGFPLDVDFGNMTPAVAKNDLLYYQNRTDPNGPAMTWAMQSIGLLQLGDSAGAASNFVRAYANQQQPFLVWTETPSGGTPNFITGAGGFLQAVVFGYPGLRIRSSGLFWLPKLYDNVANVKLVGVSYLGNRMDVEYDAKQVSFTVQPDADVLVRGSALPKHGLCVLDVATGSTYPLVAGKPITLTLSSQGFLVQKYPQL